MYVNQIILYRFWSDLAVISYFKRSLRWSYQHLDRIRLRGSMDIFYNYKMLIVLIMYFRKFLCKFRHDLKMIGYILGYPPTYNLIQK